MSNIVQNWPKIGLKLFKMVSKKDLKNGQKWSKSGPFVMLGHLVCRLWEKANLRLFEA